MRKRIFLLAALTTMLCLQNAEAAKLVAISGAGKDSCGNWTKAQAHRPQVRADGLMQVTFADIDSLHQTSWVQGFLTAFNYYSSASGFAGESTDPNGIFAWIDSYCAAHPLDTIATAAVALVSELSAREPR